MSLHKETTYVKLKAVKTQHGLLVTERLLQVDDIYPDNIYLPITIHFCGPHCDEAVFFAGIDKVVFRVYQIGSQLPVILYIFNSKISNFVEFFVCLFKRLVQKHIFYADFHSIQHC